MVLLGCIKTFQSFTAIQKHLNMGKHKVKLAKKSAKDEIKRKWTEACHHSLGGWLRSSSDLRQNSDERSLSSQVEFGVFGKHKKQPPFLRKQRIIS